MSFASLSRADADVAWVAWSGDSTIEVGLGGFRAIDRVARLSLCADQ